MHLKVVQQIVPQLQQMALSGAASERVSERVREKEREGLSARMPEYIASEKVRYAGLAAINASFATK